MNRTLFQIEVDDYLDLYLYAKNLGDLDWQKEIKNHLAKIVVQKPASFQAASLLQQYQELNEELKDLYKKLRQPSQDHALYEKLWKLKKEKVELRRKIKTAFHSSI